jgi:hypothetical protein
MSTRVTGHAHATHIIDVETMERSCEIAMRRAGSELQWVMSGVAETAARANDR